MQLDGSEGNGQQYAGQPLLVVAVILLMHLGKQIQSSVPKGCEGMKAEGALDAVYIDLIDPQHVPLVNGNLYIFR